MQVRSFGTNCCSFRATAEKGRNRLHASKTDAGPCRRFNRQCLVQKSFPLISSGHCDILHTDTVRGVVSMLRNDQHELFLNTYFSTDEKRKYLAQKLLARVDFFQMLKRKPVYQFDLKTLEELICTQESNRISLSFVKTNHLVMKKLYAFCVELFGEENMGADFKKLAFLKVGYFTKIAAQNVKDPEFVSVEDFEEQTLLIVDALWKADMMRAHIYKKFAMVLLLAYFSKNQILELKGSDVNLNNKTISGVKIKDKTWNMLIHALNLEMTSRCDDLLIDIAVAGDMSASDRFGASIKYINSMCKKACKNGTLSSYIPLSVDRIRLLSFFAKTYEVEKEKSPIGETLVAEDVFRLYEKTRQEESVPKYEKDILFDLYSSWKEEHNK